MNKEIVMTGANAFVLCKPGRKDKLSVFLDRLLPTKVLADLVGKFYAK